MERTVPIKEFRMNLAEIADSVQMGNSFVVMRRSKKAFKVVPADTETDEHWETVIDFTEGGKTAGVSATEVITALRELAEEE